MFREVRPEEIPEVWGFLETGLSAIQKRCNAPWSVAMIRAHLLNARATVYVRPEGFVVLERCAEPLTFEPYLNVWFMWFQPGEGVKLKDEIVAWLDGASRHFRCAWWQFASPRDEWAGMIRGYCKKVMTTWRRN